MEPSSPVIAGLGPEKVIAENQAEYRPLPALFAFDGSKVLTRWTFTQEEREAIARGADLFIAQWVFRHGLQPMCPEVCGHSMTEKEFAESLGIDTLLAD